MSVYKSHQYLQIRKHFIIDKDCPFLMYKLVIEIWKRLIRINDVIDVWPMIFNGLLHAATAYNVMSKEGNIVWWPFCSGNATLREVIKSQVMTTF